MKPIKFKGMNCTFAVHQPEYIPLPALKKEINGSVTSCWKANFKERIKILFNGRIYLTLLTFNNPLQPQRLHTELP